MDEERPLLQHSISFPRQNLSHSKDEYTQFCILAGIPPSNLPPDAKWPKPPRTSIYQRAKRKEAAQRRMYIFTAVLTNTLLLLQIVIGAALTALGASGTSGFYVAIFGATNTVIAGLVTYLKSRGQPMRSKMFRDDLERVVDQIENSETMWLGISRRMHGYDEIDTDDEVSVRSEVARLTRLYDKAVRTNTNNNPDMYLSGPVGGPDTTGGLRARPAAVAAPATVDAAPSPVPAPVPVLAVPDEDESPATKPKPADTPPATTEETPKNSVPNMDAAADTKPAPNTKTNNATADPDASPQDKISSAAPSKESGPSQTDTGKDADAGKTDNKNTNKKKDTST